MNKIIYTVVAVVVIGAGIWFWRSNKSANAPTTGDVSSTVAPVDTAASMNADLNSVPVQDADFQAVDKDSASL